MAVYHDDFEVMLHDECVVDGQTYVVTTSTNGLIYRVEILEDHELVDAIEVECDDLRFEPQSEQLFISLYTQAHSETREKYCTVAKEPEEVKSTFVEKPTEIEQQVQEDEMFEAKTSFESMLERVHAFYGQVKKKIQDRGYNHRVVLPMALLGMLFFFLLMGRVLICSDFVEQNFLTQGSEKVAYFKQTESFCHKLEKGCKALSQSNREQAHMFTPEECRQWCEDATIDAQACSMFLPYFPKEEAIVTHYEEAPVEPIPSETEPKEAYLFYPQGTVELLSSGTVELSIHNQTVEVLSVELVDMSLHENEHEEIVQFRKGLTSFYVNKGEEKAFKLFLEPTYYEAFDRGKYTGELTFKVKSKEGKIDEVKKDFFFRVE